VERINQVYYRLLGPRAPAAARVAEAAGG